MDAERFQRIMELFEAAMDLDPDERGAFLDEKCHDDLAMQKEIEKMLAVDAVSEKVLESLIPENFPDDRSPNRLIGTRLGQYKIQRVISSGGMGTVYEALQEKPRRTVAVKVMKEGIVSKSLLRRFEYESQILARLRHPNIAQVFEAGTHRFSGTTESGATHAVPYFVMEYIPNALPITEYVHGKKLSIRESLGLFIQACEAVHCGHQKGIIHRDLKPANILVDSHGHVQVIDFGVARATDSDLALTTLQTEVGQLIGTLQYMSPEQCEADPHDLDTRSDVYSLGIVLYELLCKKLPYDVRKLSVYEAIQRIRDTQPTRPSTSLRVLKGDTETIVLKALEKDRERRYQSADELRRDIERYLKGEPIIARPPSVLYQLKTFTRRNKALVGGVLAAFTALLIGFIVSLSLYFRAEDARKEAAWEAETTKAVNNFFNEMLASIDPMQINIISGFLSSEGGAPLPPRISENDVSVEEMIDHAAGRVAETFEGRPELEAEVRMRIGLTYQSMGLRQKAKSQLKAALLIRRNHLGEDHPDTHCSRIQLAFMNRGSGPVHRAEAISDAETAYEGLKRIYGKDHPHTLTSATVLAMLQALAGNFEVAEPLFRETLKAQERVLGEEDRNTLWTRSEWAYLLVIKGALLEAQKELQVVFDIVERAGSPYDKNDYIVVFSKTVLGGCKMFMGEHAYAEELLRDSITRAGSILGEKHWIRYAAMWCLALSLKGESTTQEQEQLFRDSLEGFVSETGYSALWTIRAVEAFCFFLCCQGRYDEILDAYQGAWKACRNDKSIPNPRKLVWLQHLAHALLNGGRFEEAEEKYREWVNRVSDIFGEEHPVTLNALADTGGLFLQIGKKKAAREFLERAIEGRRRIASTEEAGVSDLNDLVNILLECKSEDLQNPEEALRMANRANELSGGEDPFVMITMARAYFAINNLDRAHEILQRILGTATPDQWQFNQNLIRYLLRLDDTETALRLIDESDARLVERGGKKSSERYFHWNTLALLLAEEGRYALAEPMARECLAYWREAPNGKTCAHIMSSILGYCLAEKDRYEEAEPLLKEGFEGMINNPIVTLDQQQQSLEWLIQLYEDTGRETEALKWKKVRPAVGLPDSDKREQ